MATKSWWAYIPDLCEQGVVVDAETLDDAIVEARRFLASYSSDEMDDWYIYELKELHGPFYGLSHEDED
jgi:predicted RNase H-like HicB family nuclease